MIPDTVCSEAINEMIQGKRHLLIKDYNSAVQSFERACQLLDEKYGKGADDCGDAYLNYGIALLELSRQETGAFDGLVNAKITDPSDAEDEEEDEDGEEESDENAEEKSQDDDEEKVDGEAKKTDTEEDISNSDVEKEANDKQAVEPVACGSSDELAPGPSKLSEATNSAEPQPETSTGGEASMKDEEDDEPTNIEISWEVLTTVRTIFERQLKEGLDVKLKLAETLQKLGEIAIEWENNDYAIEVLTECLQLRKEALPSDDRLIAETYYHIGNAHAFISQIENANDCFQLAIEVINNRIANKRLMFSNTEKAGDSELAKSIDQEIKDLESLLPEMKARIEDKQDQMTTVKEAMERAANEEMQEKQAEEKAKQISVKPINNVTHLVKRKAPVGDHVEESKQKKLCSDEGRNVTSEVDVATIPKINGANGLSGNHVERTENNAEAMQTV